MKKESGRSMIEMIMVLAIIGILGIGAIASFRGAQVKAELGRIEELVSVVSLTARTKMTELCWDPANTCNLASSRDVWKSTGKKQTDYPCVSYITSYTVGHRSGYVSIRFNAGGKCERIGEMAQESAILSGSLGGTYTYTPPEEDD